MSRSKINADDVQQIRKLLRKKEMTQQQIAELYPVSRAQISNIKNKRAWEYI